MNKRTAVVVEWLLAIVAGVSIVALWTSLKPLPALCACALVLALAIYLRSRIVYRACPWDEPLNDEVRHQQTETALLELPKWETVSDEDGVMHHVRWSKPNKRGEYFMCAHYPERWRAESQADEWNRKGRSPWSFRDFARGGE
jgi:hypothetical protein